MIGELVNGYFDRETVETMNAIERLEGGKRFSSDGIEMTASSTFPFENKVRSHHLNNMFLKLKHKVLPFHITLGPL